MAGMQWCVVALLAVGCGFHSQSGSGASVDASAATFTDAFVGGPDARVDDAVTLELLAGSIGGSGDIDATGIAARFNSPLGVTVDSQGNLFIADSGNDTIRKMTPAGVVTTFAGTPGVAGGANGTGAAAQFSFPRGIVTDRADNLFVTDGDGDTLRKITPAGVVTTLAGAAAQAGSADGAGAAARFATPAGLAIDGAGTLYVADAGNNAIRKVTPAGVVTTIAGMAGPPGCADGAGTSARFSFPTDVAIDGAGDLYVADENNHTLRKIAPAGAVTTFAGTPGAPGFIDGASGTMFHTPADVVSDAAGNLYVADNDNHAIREVRPSQIVTTIAGDPRGVGSQDGVPARFRAPSGLALDPAGNLYVTDTGSQTIRKITPQGVVSTIAGAVHTTGSADGTGAAAQFAAAGYVATDRAGNVYFADSANRLIRKITPAGVVTTLAGKAGISDAKDGTGSAARFVDPVGITTDGAGNVFVSDEGLTIRKITPDGTVTTLAGLAGAPGSANGTGAAARFDHAFGLASDAAGNLFVADNDNATIRKVTPGGVVTTFAGQTGVPGDADGNATTAQFTEPRGVAIDGAGNLYVTEDDHRVRMITPGGVVSTLAGGSKGSADGTGSAASFGFLQGVAVDDAGNVYVAELDNHTIRKITPAGVTTTIAGSPTVFGTQLGDAPHFSTVIGLAIIGDSLVISDNSAILVLRHGAR